MQQIKKTTGSFKSSDGTKIYYEARGEGRPIVLAYGIGCLINHWLFQYRHFAQEYQTIVFDYRSHHKSGSPEDPDNVGLNYFADDISGLMKELNINDACFFGHSFGVQVLVKTYDLYPELFNSLVFINGFASDPITPMFGNGLASNIFNSVKLLHGMVPDTSSYLWKKLIESPLTAQMTGLAGGFNLSLTQLKDIEIYARGVGNMDLSFYLKLMEKMMGYDGRDIFGKIEVPTLIVSGQNDSVTPQSYQEEMHKKIRNSEYVSVPYGSHCTQLDMPDYVNLKIEQFLKKSS